MSDEGAVVTVAKDGLQAVNIFKEKPEGSFDAILMDIMMPVMDGLTATKKIRTLNIQMQKNSDYCHDSKCIQRR